MIPYAPIPDETKRNYFNKCLTMRKKDFKQGKLSILSQPICA